MKLLNLTAVIAECDETLCGSHPTTAECALFTGRRKDASQTSVRTAGSSPRRHPRAFAIRGALPRDPTRRPCLLDLHQGQWPLEPFILAGESGRAPTRTLKGHSRRPPTPQPMDRSQRGSPFAGVQGQSPWRVSGQRPGVDPGPCHSDRRPCDNRLAAA